MDIKNFHTGQIAFLDSGRNRKGEAYPLTEVTVTKVGRKYVTVKRGWGEYQFCSTRTTDKYLIEKTDYGSADRLYALREDCEEQRELERLRDWMRKAGSWEAVGKYTLEQLREVKTIIER